MVSMWVGTSFCGAVSLHCGRGRAVAGRRILKFVGVNREILTWMLGSWAAALLGASRFALCTISWFTQAFNPIESINFEID